MITIATGPAGQYEALGAVSAHAAVSANVHGILDVADMYRPSLRLPKWPQANPALTNFQSGHGFTAGGAGSSNLNDSTNFVRGTQSASVTSAGTGAQTNLDNFAVSALDLTAKLVRLTFKVDDITHLASINFFLGTSSLANNFRWRVQTTSNNATASNYIQSGEWVTITLGWADVAGASGTFTFTSGTPSTRSGFTNVRCQAIDDNTGNPVTVHWQSIELIADGSATFPNGVVSIGFDDSWQSVYDLARPKLDQYGYGATMWTITDLVGSGSTRITATELLNLQDRSGWEIAAHAYQNADHTLNDTGMTAAQLDLDARNQKAWLVGNGFRGEGHAYPSGKFGTTADGVSTTSMLRRYFAYGRTILASDTIETFPPADPFKLRALSGVSSVGTNRQLPANLTGAGTLLDKVKTNQAWLILVFHEFLTSGTPTNTTQCLQSDFNSVVDGINSRGIPCMPVADVLRYYG